jgi:hypothetical protein
MGEQLCGAAGLGAAALVEGDIELPHDAQLRVPVGFAVADEKDTSFIEAIHRGLL